MPISNKNIIFYYAKSVMIQIKKPYNLSTMNDDYQNAVLKEETPDHGVFDFILYPCNTNDVQSNYDWKEYAYYPELQKYLEPTITANRDEELKSRIIADLKTTK